MKIRNSLLLISIWMLFSCAVPKSPTTSVDINTANTLAVVLGQTPAQDKMPAELRWWYARFKINWPTDSAKRPDWAIDALLADQVCEPALLAHHSKIVLWRFHRRAVPDRAGHQFSFIFYADADTAQAVYQHMQQNDVLIELLLSDRLAALNVDELNVFKRPNIEDTSDPNWSLMVQKAWPAFIMGVSSTWLELINQIVIAEQLDTREMELDALIALYQRINNTVDELWLGHGRHAFLHHLNALFGYRPIYMNY